MGKWQRLFYFTAFGLVVALSALILIRSVGRTERVVLPESQSIQSGEAVQEQEDALTAVEITPKTVGWAVEALGRPAAYSRTVTVETFWSGGSGTAVTTIAQRDGWTRVDTHNPVGDIRHVLTDGAASYIWYNDEDAWFAGQSGGITADDEHSLPTYEDIVALPAKQIQVADYRLYEGLRCIYVQTGADALGYVQHYWVSVDSGLLVAAERWQQQTLTQRVTALGVDTALPDESLFLLPDGSKPS